MPLVGPNYFSSGTASISYWVSPQNAENAPDGVFAYWTSGTLGNWLYMFGFQGSIPPGYYYDFSNFVVEMYANSGAQTRPFITQIILSNSGATFGTPSSNKSIALTSSTQWFNISNNDWSIPNPLPTDVPIGIAISLNMIPSFNIYVDSVRMTISYNSIDNFFNPPYGVVRGRRRYVATRNRQTKVIMEEVRPRMLRRIPQRKVA